MSGKANSKLPQTVRVKQIKRIPLSINIIIPSPTKLPPLPLPHSSKNNMQIRK